jgi:hypothetical protein
MLIPQAMHARNTAQRLPRRALLDLSIIFLLGALFLSPILISPHFGLFSDYGQILGWPARNIHTIRDFWTAFHPLSDGRWTPMFHILTFGLYTLIGPSAFGFYFVQGITLLLSLLIVYLLARWLAHGNRAAGWAASLLILLSAPMAENYFTLDKVEPRIVFFSLLSFGYFAWRVSRARENPAISLPRAGLVFAVELLMAVLIVFSKETGAFMSGVAFLALVAASLQKDRDRRIVKEAALFFASFAAALALYFWLSSALMPELSRTLREQNAGVGRYLNYGITAGLVLENLRGYAFWMRDTAVCAISFCAWIVAGLWNVRRNWDDRDMFLFLAGAGGCLYFGGMLFWRWMLLYYMLPAVVFLAIAIAAIVFDVRVRTPSRIAWSVAILLLIVFPTAVRLPGRWRTGWTILAQDRSKDALVRAMERQAASHSKFVVAMFDVQSAEIGNSLERYLDLDGYRGKTFVYNLVEGPWVNFANKHRYDGSAAEPPTEEEIVAARDLHSPFVIWRYEPRREIHRIWWMEPLAPGDLLVLPVGSSSNAQVKARGIPTFSNSRDYFLNSRFPGVHTTLLEEARVPVPLSHDFLGWDLLEVTEIDPAAVNLAGLDHELTGLDPGSLDPAQTYLGSGWSHIDFTSAEKKPGEPFRWGLNDAQMILPRTSTPASVILDLEPNGQLARLPIRIRILDHNQHEIAAPALNGRMKIELQAPAGEQVSLRLPDQIHTAPDTICFRLFGISSSVRVP